MKNVAVDRRGLYTFNQERFPIHLYHFIFHCLHQNINFIELSIHLLCLRMPAMISPHERKFDVKFAENVLLFQISFRDNLLFILYFFLLISSDCFYTTSSWIIIVNDTI